MKAMDSTVAIEKSINCNSAGIRKEKLVGNSTTINLVEIATSALQFSVLIVSDGRGVLTLPCLEDVKSSF